MDTLGNHAFLEGFLRPTQNATKTSLYSLIEAVQDEVYPGGDALVVAVVTHLMRSGRIRIPLSDGTSQLLAQR
jgi:hypothetical protein